MSAGLNRASTGHPPATPNPPRGNHTPSSGGRTFPPKRQTKHQNICLPPQRPKTERRERDPSQRTTCTHPNAPTPNRSTRAWSFARRSRHN